MDSVRPPVADVGFGMGSIGVPPVIHGSEK